MNAGNRKQVRSHPERWIAFLVCMACGLCVTQPAFAQFVVPPHTVQALGTCDVERIYNSQSANTPSLIAHSFRGQGSSVTFRVCTDRDQNTHYFIRKPRPNRNGICRVFEEELFPGNERDMQIVDVLYDGTMPGWYFTMTGWKSWPPTAWAKLHYSPQSQILAQAGDGACPATDDKGYVPVGSMTDGMLHGFFKLWHDVSYSPEAFDKAFANTTSVAIIGMGFKEDHAALVRELRDDLFEKHSSPRPEFLRCDLGNLPGCTAYFDRFDVGFDVGDQGMVLTRIDPVLIP